MRSVAYFVEDELIKKLLRKFRISQGQLYHYTSEEAASSICDGEFWLTRADCFQDKSEIQYGENLLKQAASQLPFAEYNAFVSLLSDAKASLNLTYVMSLSQEFRNPHLLEAYGQAIIELDERFPISIRHEGMHAIPMDDGGYRAYFFDTLYDFFEGLVIYDEKEQLQISLDVCNAYRKVVNSEHLQKTDCWHFVEIIKRCLILFKHNSFSPEREYRLSITYRQGSPNTFECTGKNERIYIKAQFNQSLVRRHKHHS